MINRNPPSYRNSSPKFNIIKNCLLCKKPFLINKHISYSYKYCSKKCSKKIIRNFMGAKRTRKSYEESKKFLDELNKIDINGIPLLSILNSTSIPILYGLNQIHVSRYFKEMN